MQFLARVAEGVVINPGKPSVPGRESDNTQARSGSSRDQQDNTHDSSGDPTAKRTKIAQEDTDNDTVPRHDNNGCGPTVKRAKVHIRDIGDYFEVVTAIGRTHDVGQTVSSHIEQGATSVTEALRRARDQHTLSENGHIILSALQDAEHDSWTRFTCLMTSKNDVGTAKGNKLASAVHPQLTTERMRDALEYAMTTKTGQRFAKRVAECARQKDTGLSSITQLMSYAMSGTQGAPIRLAMHRLVVAWAEERWESRHRICASIRPTPDKVERSLEGTRDRMERVLQRAYGTDGDEGLFWSELVSHLRKVLDTLGRRGPDREMQLTHTLHDLVDGLSDLFGNIERSGRVYEKCASNPALTSAMFYFIGTFIGTEHTRIVTDISELSALLRVGGDVVSAALRTLLTGSLVGGHATLLFSALNLRRGRRGAMGWKWLTKVLYRIRRAHASNAAFDYAFLSWLAVYGKAGVSRRFPRVYAQYILPYAQGSDHYSRFEHSLPQATDTRPRRSETVSTAQAVEARPAMSDTFEHGAATTAPARVGRLVKYISYNLNSLHASLVDGTFLYLVRQADADVIAIQETMISDKSNRWRIQACIRVLRSLGYLTYWHAGTRNRGGYGGVMVATRERPEAVIQGMGDEAMDAEGRVLTLVYPSSILLNTYAPTLDLDLSPAAQLRKTNFTLAIRKKIQDLREAYPGRPLLWGGDMNVCRHPHDHYSFGPTGLPVHQWRGPNSRRRWTDCTSDVPLTHNQVAEDQPYGERTVTPFTEGRVGTRERWGCV